MRELCTSGPISFVGLKVILSMAVSEIVQHCEISLYDKPKDKGLTEK